MMRFSQFLLFGFCVSCLASGNFRTNTGILRFENSGDPEFFGSIDFELSQDSIFILLQAEVLKSSLFFFTENMERRAATTMLVEVLSPDSTVKRSNVQNVVFRESDFSNARNSALLNYRFPFDPAMTSVRMILIDKFSQRPRTVVIPITRWNLGNSNVEIYPIIVKNHISRDKYNWVTSSSYSQVEVADSTRFSMLYNPSDSSLNWTIRTFLVRFPADTSIPRPIYQQNLSTSSLAFFGVDYKKRTVIDRSERSLKSIVAPTLFEKTYVGLKTGIYRYVVEFRDEKGVLRESLIRDFSIRKGLHPFVKTPNDLAAPLAYLMDDREFKELSRLNQRDSVLAAVEKFWLRKTGDKESAKDVMNLFYSRVEEANRLFSNYKEGWKTDMGYIYILFGPPKYIDQVFNSTVWKYGYDHSIPHRVFEFERARIKSDFFPFDHYILKRAPLYFNPLRQRKKDWRDGTVLSGSLF